jgi:glycosyltransferase involved in cell wall biosynthesis
MKSHTNHPFVSIVIPTHRYEHLKNAIACAEAQTYRNLEILVLDNSYRTEIQAYCEAKPRIRYIRNSEILKEINSTIDENKLQNLISSELVDFAFNSMLRDAATRKNTAQHWIGGVLTRELMPRLNVFSGFKYAEGDYIKFLDDDDLIFPHCVSAMVNALNYVESNSDRRIGVVTSSRQHIDGENNVIDQFDFLALVGQKSATMIGGADITKFILTKCTNVIGELSSVLISRTFVPDNYSPCMHNMFKDDFVGLYDVPLFFEILSKSDMVYIPAPLSAFRKHSNQGSNYKHNPGYYLGLIEWYRLIKHYEKLNFLNKADLAQSFTNYLAILNKLDGISEPKLADIKAQVLLSLRNI